MVQMKPAYRANNGESDLNRDVAALIHESRQIRAETEVKITELQTQIERCRRTRERFQEACRNGSIWVPPIKFHRGKVQNSSYVLPIVLPPVSL